MESKISEKEGTKNGEALFLPADLCDDLCCCVICFEPFTEKRIPKALPCLHTFCRDCLVSTMDAHKKLIVKRPPSRSRTNELKNLICPVCKEVTKIPENGIDGFKDDFRIRKISEVLAKTRNLPRQQSYADKNASPQKDSVKMENSENEIQCDFCKFGDKETTAVLYCIECSKMLCRDCAEDHINTGITKDHDIVDACDRLPTETVCKLHVTEVLKYFCCTCKQPVCMACTFSEAHKGHDVIRLNEHTTQIRLKIQDLVEECDRNMPDINAKMNELKSVEQALNSKEKTAQRAILQRTFDEISKVRSNQSKMEHELEEVCRTKYNELQRKKKDISGMTERLEFTKLLLSKGHDIQLVCMEENLVEGLKTFCQSKAEIKTEEISFTDLGKYEGLVEDIELAHKDEGSTRSAILADIKSVLSQMRMFSAGRSDTKPELIKKIGKKGGDDGEFSFPSGVAIFPSGDIAVADLHNHRVQIFTSEGVFLNKFGDDEFKPCGIAITKDNLLAVTDCSLSANCIKIYTMTGIFKQSLGVGEFDYPFSIAINSKGRFVVSDPAINKITVVNGDGALHRRFGTRSKFCFYLTVNNRDEVILSDWYNHCVKVFSSSGQLLRKIGSHGSDDGKLLIPLGIVTDLRGNIFVLDCKSSKLSMFAADGRFLRNVINQEHGMEYSRAIDLAKDGRLVITTGDNKRDVPNELYIFQL